MTYDLLLKRVSLMILLLIALAVAPPLHVAGAVCEKSKPSTGPTLVALNLTVAL